MRIKIGELKQVGLNQYMDSSGRYIIPDKKNHIGYVVEKEDFRRYTIYSSRFVLAFIAGFFAGSMMEWYVGVFVGILALIFLQLSYTSKFLPSLPSVTNVDFPPRKSFKQRLVESNDLMKAWTMVITSALIPFVSGALLYQTFPGFKVDLANTTLENKTLLVLLPVLSGFAVYTCVASLAGIKEMKAQNKQ